jgi:putative phage-type endonuclease
MTPIELIPPGESGPSNPRWHEARRAGVTASEIAAVMGLSPWESPFSLYWRKANAWDTGDNEFMSAGRHLEDAIADWWIAENDPIENLVMRPAGLYAHPERPWQLATPDRLLHLDQCVCGARGDLLCSCLPNDGPLLALLECKWVAHSWDGWGEPGTDDIPVYYRAQCLWQADVMGVDEVHLAALGPGGFRAYRVRRDEKDLRVMRAAGLAFHRSIENGDAPDVDSHSATADALKRVFPGVGDGPIEVPVELAEGYRRARLLKKRLTTQIDRYEARIRAVLGDTYSRAECGGRLVASRSVFERTATDEDELNALDQGWPITDRLNPGQKLEHRYAC